MPEKVDGFAGLGLDPRLTAALAYGAPTPIQREAIPTLLLGRDLIGLAGTGTGKTAAFALPLVHRLVADPAAGLGPAALVLVPTRELAIQVANAVSAYGRPVGTRVLAVYGGTGYADQSRACAAGWTWWSPPRAGPSTSSARAGSTSRGSAPSSSTRPTRCSTWGSPRTSTPCWPPPRRAARPCFSRPPCRRGSRPSRRAHLRDPLRVRVAADKPVGDEPAAVRQTAYVVRAEHKVAALGRILVVERPASAIVFCRTREAADELTEALSRRDFRPLALHGGMTQDQRDRVMQRFRAGAADLLVATDVAARGLDISQLSHVINFDLPDQPDTYVHRIGRVGRAGRAGVAITLVTPREQAGLLADRAGDRPEDRGRPGADRRRPAGGPRRPRSGRPSGPSWAGRGPTRRPRSWPSWRPSSRRPMWHGPRPGCSSAPAGRGRSGHPGPGPRLEAGPPAGPRAGRRRRTGARPTRAGMSKVFFGIGRDARVTPKDLVGAICNEAGIPSRDLGAIDLTDRFALVEVPADLAGYVVEAMQGMRIRGRTVHVRPDRPPRRP